MSTRNTIFTFLALSIVLLTGLVFKNSPYAPDLQSVQGVATNEASASALTVTRVTDGDTLELSSGEKVRLIGMNTPEKNQPYFEDAKKALEDMVLNKEIRVETDISETDMYGRVLGYVFVGDVFVNQKMVENGYAVVSTTPPDVKYVEAFVKAIDTAKKNCVGMWEGICSPTESSCIQISKINPIGSLKNDEWIELVNTCSTSQNLANFLIKDNSASNFYKFDTASVSAKASVRIHSGCGINTQKNYYWKCPEQHNFIWNNDSDRAYLFDSAGKLISETGY
ncbi:MAG: thermonuclease family protein [Candidatus Levybacteria bacterium]|nr:thermonuclease family protein [Candidatus Levybacteria bacterium]